MRTATHRPGPSGRRGVAATELALLLPFLAFLFFVAVDYCRAYRAAEVIDTAARSGALYASRTAARDPDAETPEQAAVRAAVTEGAGLSPPLRSEDVTVTPSGPVVTVTVSYRFAMVTSYTGVSDGVTITRSVTMIRAPQPPGAR